MREVLDSQEVDDNMGSKVIDKVGEIQKEMGYMKREYEIIDVSVKELLGTLKRMEQDELR